MNAKQQAVLETLVKRSAITARFFPQQPKVKPSTYGNYIFADWDCWFDNEDNYLTKMRYSVTIGVCGAVQYYDGKKWRKAKYNVICSMKSL